MRKHIDRIDTALKLTFTLLIGTVPLAMHPYTSELFEFNKMWLVYIYALIIFFLWGTKAIIQRKIEIRRTPFDIPLLLFFASQLIATVISMDPHTSFWGYYSRFNGGFLSTLSYIFIYYAFVSNFSLSKDEEENEKFNIYLLLAGIFSFVIGIFIASELSKEYAKSGTPQVGWMQTFFLIEAVVSSFTFFHFAFKFGTLKKFLAILLTSGAIVALWGLPSHFGYDPTCFIFRGTMDVSCWTEAFQPKIRMFSTLGQPNWLAAFLLVLVPISSALTVNAAKKVNFKNPLTKAGLLFLLHLSLTFLFYLDLGWTLSQSGFVGFWVGNIIFVLIFGILTLRKHNFSLITTLKHKGFLTLLMLQVLFIATMFVTKNPVAQIYVNSIMQRVNQPQQGSSTAPTPQAAKQPVAAPAQPALEAGITGSGDIRKIVWKGAIDIWKAYPVFGSGVETYAFAYYKFRPAEHNLTSEWDYLYNKAHNEFLNYLATTGAFGLGTYLLFIASFLFFAFKIMAKQWKRKLIGNPLLPAFIGGFVGIMVSNFFGFSVVIVNLLTFLLPLLYWASTKPTEKYLLIPEDSTEGYVTSESPGTGRIMVIIGIGAFSLYSIIFLLNYWNADVNYGLGYNYNRINAFQQANPSLEEAVKMRGGEDLYKNELSVNLAALALTAAQQKDLNTASQYATRAKDLSDEVARDNPNNVVYWKARTRVMFSLAELSTSVLPDAVAAIEKARELAPTDAKVVYNQALIYDQVGRKAEAKKLLELSIKLKSNYRDAYYAQALFLTQEAEQEKDVTIKNQKKKQASDILNFVLKNVAPGDKQTEDLLKSL